MGLGKGVRVLSPEGAIAPTGTWSLGARAGDFVFVAGMLGINPMKVQEEIWSGGPYPPRTIVEVAALNQDDFFEVEGTFYSPKSR